MSNHSENDHYSDHCHHYEDPYRSIMKQSNTRKRARRKKCLSDSDWQSYRQSSQTSFICSKAYIKMSLTSRSFTAPTVRYTCWSQWRYPLQYVSIFYRPISHHSFRNGFHKMTILSMLLLLTFCQWPVTLAQTYAVSASSSSTPPSLHYIECKHKHTLFY